MAQAQQDTKVPKEPESAQPEQPEDPVMVVQVEESVVVTTQIPVAATDAPAGIDGAAADVVTYVETTSTTLEIPLTEDYSLNAATEGLSLDEKAGAGEAESEPAVVLVFAGGPYSVTDDVHDKHCHQSDANCAAFEGKEAQKAQKEETKAAEGAGGLPPSAEVGGTPAQNGGEGKRSAKPEEAAGGPFPVGDEVHGSHSVEAKVPEVTDGGEGKRSAKPEEAAGGPFPVGDEVHGSHSVEAKVPQKTDASTKTLE